MMRMNFKRTLCLVSFFSILTSVVSERALHSAQMIEPNDIQNCRAKVDEYLNKKLSQATVDRERALGLKPIYETCQYWLTQKSSEVSGSQVSGELIIDSASLDAELAELGFISDMQRPVVVLASEVMGKNLVESFFTIGKASSQNECEISLGASLLSRGFKVSLPDDTPESLLKMRSLKPVMGRYKDLSSLPNVTAGKAGSIVDKLTEAVIGCQAKVDVSQENDIFKACSKARCKVIDSKDLRRISAFADSACEENSDKTTATIAAVKKICEIAGQEMATAMIDHFSAGEGK